MSEGDDSDVSAQFRELLAQCRKLYVTSGELALDSHELEQVVLRLRRAQGQLGAVATMLEERRGCREVVHQLAAVKKAIDRSGFVLLEAAVRQCVTSPGATSDDLKAMEKLFLALS